MELEAILRTNGVMEWWSDSRIIMEEFRSQETVGSSGKCGALLQPERAEGAGGGDDEKV
jgi:hypothetical protein